MKTGTQRALMAFTMLTILALLSGFAPGATHTARAARVLAPAGLPPDAVDDAVSTPEDTFIVINVLNNDLPKNGTLFIKAAGPASHGTVSFTKNNVTYAPDPDYSGPDQFPYTISDGAGGTDSAIVIVTIVAANELPVAESDQAATPQDTPLTVLVLANDSDADGGVLVVSAVSNPPHGTATFDNSSVTYTPDTSFLGSDVFTYTINDGQGGTSQATVTVAVYPQADLSIMKNVAPNPAFAGSQVSYTLQASNHGPTSLTGALTFNSSPSSSLTIAPYGPAMPYPSTVDVSGLVGTVSKVTVTLHGLSHTFPSDLDLLLTGPQGQTALLMSDAGGGLDLIDKTLTFDDTAPDALPQAGPIAGNIYQPANYPGSPDTFSAPAPGGPYLVSLAGFSGSDPNGHWYLYAYDSVEGDSGAIAGGWSLGLELAPPQVTVTDHLPAGFTYSGYTAPGWDCLNAGGVVTCSTTGLAKGATQEIILTANTPNLTGVYTNTVQIASPLHDPDLADNEASAAVTLGPVADLSIFKTANTTTAVPGQTITYTLNYQNNGPNTATGVVISDALPIELQNATLSSSGAAISEQGSGRNHLWQVADLLPGQGGVITVRGVLSAPLAAGLVIPNTATITSPCDPNLNNNHSTASITITNLAPQAKDDTDTTAEDNFVVIAVLANDVDLNGDTLTISNPGTPAHGSAVEQSGAIRYTPDPDFYGQDEFTYTISDGSQSASAKVSLTVTPVNDAPILDTIPDQVVDEGSLLSFSAHASDVDLPNDSLTYTLNPGAPTGATINASSGLFTWTPAEAQGAGVYYLTVTVTDSSTTGASDSQTFKITVNEVNNAPVLGLIGNMTVNEGDTAQFTAIASDGDPTLDNLSFSLEPGAPAGAAVDPTSGLFTWATGEAQGPGNYEVTVKVTDTGLPNLSDSQLFTIHVNELNQAPTLQEITGQTVDEGVQLKLTAVAGDNDLPANSLSFSLEGGAPAGAAINASSGELTWTPSEVQGPGDYTLTLRVTDNGSPALWAHQSFVVHVNEVNQAPAISAIGTKAVQEGLQLAFTVPASDADRPANNLSFTLDPGAPTGLKLDPGSGQLTWTPGEADGPGAYSVTVRVTDDGQPVLDASQTFTINVQEANLAPSLDPVGSQAVAEGSLLSFTASAHDADLPANSVVFSLLSGAPAGADIDANSGLFTWTPTEAQGPGVYPITIQVSDNGLPPLSATRTFNVTVNEVNNFPPSANDDAFTLPEDNAPAPLNLLANDSGAPDGGEILTIVQAGPASHGTVTLNAGAVTYQPAANYYGDDAFSYTLSDGTLSDTAQVTLTITPQNDPPAAIEDVVTTAEDTPLSIAVLANDSDVELDALALVFAGSAGHGTVQAVGNSALYTPDPDYFGTDIFYYTVTDGKLTSQGKVSVTITPVNDAPQAANDLALTQQNTPITIAVLANDHDVDGDPLVVSAVGTAAHGTLTFQPGAVSYTPAEDFHGSDVFTYTVTDGALSASASVTVNVSQTFYQVYLPSVLQPGKPDLVVSLQLVPDKRTFTAGEAVQVSVVVTNQGDYAAQGGFWVDFYINPSTPPTAANMTWDRLCDGRCHGIAWLVQVDLAPGESITLTSTSDSYSAKHTVWPGWFASGTTDLYAYADVWKPGDTQSAIHEKNENNNRAEIHGLLVTGKNPSY